MPKLKRPVAQYVLALDDRTKCPLKGRFLQKSLIKTRGAMHGTPWSGLANPDDLAKHKMSTPAPSGAFLV